MPPVFTHPVILCLWSIAVATAAIFGWLSLNNWLAFRNLRTRSAKLTLRFTLAGCASALAVIAVLIPMEPEAKLHVFRLLWITGGTALGFWILAVADFCDLRSPAFKVFAALSFGIAIPMFLDLVAKAVFGVSVAYEVGPSGTNSLFLQATGDVRRHRWLADLLGPVSVLVVTGAGVVLIHQLRRHRPDEYLLQVGALFTVLSGALQASLIRTPYAMPLFFVANLLEAARMTYAQTQQLGSAVTELQQVRDAQSALIEHQLEELQTRATLAEIGEQTARITHDLRNPLTSALAALELLSEEVAASGKAPLVELVDISRTSLEHVLRLVRRITRHAKDEHDAPFEPVSLAAVVSNAKLLCRHRLENIEVSEDIPEGLVVVGHETELVQLLVNLLTNAADAMEGHASPRLAISALERNGRATLRVQDAGQRPSDAIVSQMFAGRFTTRKQGTGLGLAICARIAKEHGGSLAVDRRESNTTLVLELPASGSRSSAA